MGSKLEWGDSHALVDSTIRQSSRIGCLMWFSLKTSCSVFVGYRSLNPTVEHKS
jgi:hypothetical protein